VVQWHTDVEGEVLGVIVAHAAKLVETYHSKWVMNLMCAGQFELTHNERCDYTYPLIFEEYPSNFSLSTLVKVSNRGPPLAS
jgi:hypothetical protein